MEALLHLPQQGAASLRLDLPREVFDATIQLMAHLLDSMVCFMPQLRHLLLQRVVPLLHRKEFVLSQSCLKIISCRGVPCRALLGLWRVGGNRVLSQHCSHNLLHVGDSEACVRGGAIAHNVPLYPILQGVKSVGQVQELSLRRLPVGCVLTAAAH